MGKIKIEYPNNTDINKINISSKNYDIIYDYEILDSTIQIEIKEGELFGILTDEVLIELQQLGVDLNKIKGQANLLADLDRDFNISNLKIDSISIYNN